MKKTIHLIVLLFAVFVSAGVFGVDTDEAKMMSVMEGDSVTLNPCVKDTIQKDVIRWRFVASRVAEKEMNKKPSDGITLYDGVDGIFRNRLHVDPQTGSLTIKNIRTNHSGLYEAELTSIKSGTIRKLFNVTVIGVFDPHSYQLKSVSVMEGTSVQLKTYVTVKKNDLMLWKFGNAPKQCSYNSIHHYPCLSDLTDIAKLVGETQEISLDNGEDQLFTDNLSLDKQTGDLTIRNTRTQHTGYYVLQISGNNDTRYRAFSVTVSAGTESQPCSKWKTLTIVFSVLGCLAALAVGIICHCKNNSTKRKLNNAKDETQELNETKSQSSP
ncbi:uncharacterized protein [Misgurnus anguillicaudatus]|uniref:uncharacterized protein isoform X1 n=1 Tax=Misgurnus anguillicaudatus TaxID=75329 RepID=UPI003CCF077F